MINYFIVIHAKSDENVKNAGLSQSLGAFYGFKKKKKIQC